MQCIIMENTLIKLTLHDETKKRAHDPQIVKPVILPMHTRMVKVLHILGITCIKVMSSCGYGISKRNNRKMTMK